MNPNAEPTSDQSVGIGWLPLFIAITITLLVTAYPHILTIGSINDSQADHVAAILLFWSMSAGYVRGVGFIPLHRLLAVLLSTQSCLLALLLTFICLYVRTTNLL